MTLAAGRGFEKYARATHKATLLARMKGLMPWAEFCGLIELALSEGREWTAAGGRGANAAAVLAANISAAFRHDAS